jgi:tetratricopeptide (TPR) repeat protein
MRVEASMARGVVLLVMALGCGGPQPEAVVTIAPLPEVDASTTPVGALRQNVVPLPPDTHWLTVRDTRRPPRAPRLLATELQGLESLFAATPTNSPDRPQLLRRLAEDYAEQRRATGEGGDKAIDRYSALVQQYPNYALLDEVHYYLGLEYETARDFMNARKTYYELIKKYPSSRHVAGAYFAFGELFLQEAKLDPSKWNLAKQAYTEVLKFGNDALRPWAMWRLGQTLDGSGDAAGAQAMYARLRTEQSDSEVIARIGEKP